MKKKILIILSILCIMGTFTGCSLFSDTQEQLQNIVLPEQVDKYFEDFKQEWPNIVQEVVDDIWSEGQTSTTKSDYIPPEEELYTPPTPTDKDDNKESSNVYYGEDLEVHFIDVGQADCILFVYNDEVMMIDAGNNDDDDLIIDYLENLNIDTIDYFVLTHPHEDHIGGADSLIDNFRVENIYMTKYTSTSKTYKDVIAAINNNAMVPNYVESHNYFKMDDIVVDVYPPYDIKTKEINNSSIIVKVTHGNNTMLFAGDTESDSEKDLLTMNYGLEADLFKANHHGSGGSNSYVWLREVNPKYVVIQSGEGNTYGHPHEEALSRFNDVGAIIYRNDKLGTIIATSDGNNIEFNKEGIIPTKEHTEK